MKLLDLFCGAGGCAVGYARAGFSEIVGVDIAPQKNYPFNFVQADAIEFCKAHGKEFDVIHASPPCQVYSITKGLSAKDHPDLVDATRAAIAIAHKPYVIENVPGAPLENPITLCGTMFGLQVLRHRLFETSPALWWPPAQCAHIGKATGGLRYNKKVPSLKDGFRYVTVAGNDFLADEGRAAMGIPWMTKRELAQAIPPAYTEWIGRQIIQRLEQ